MAPAAEPCGTWYLRQVDLFRGLTEQEVEAFAALTERRTYHRGELIIGLEGPADRLYIVEQGSVRLFYRGPDGREITADVIGRGRLFGVSRLFGPALSGLLAEAATDVVVCVSDARRFLAMLRRAPAQVLRNLVEQLGAQVLEAEQRLHGVASGDARARLAGALYRLARDAAEDAPGGGRRITERITHPALARLIGTTRETVTRSLASLEADGYIRREGRRLLVVDPARLARAFGLEET